MRGIVSLSLLLVGLLAGCVHVTQEPPIAMPVRPYLKFYRVEGGVCLSDADADQMLRYIIKLNEFEQARDRLLKR